MYYGGGRWRSPQEKGNLGASPSPLCSPGSPQEKVNLGASPSPLCSPGTLCRVCFRAHVVIASRVVFIVFWSACMGNIRRVPKLFVIRQQPCGLSLLVLQQLVIHYFVPERCEVLRLSYLSVGLSVCSLEYFKRTARTNSTKFSVGLHVACCRSSVFSRRRNTLCTSGFADDVRYIPER